MCQPGGVPTGVNAGRRGLLDPVIALTRLEGTSLILVKNPSASAAIRDSPRGAVFRGVVKMEAAIELYAAGRCSRRQFGYLSDGWRVWSGEYEGRCVVPVRRDFEMLHVRVILRAPTAGSCGAGVDRTEHDFSQAPQNATPLCSEDVLSRVLHIEKAPYYSVSLVGASL